MDPQPPDVSNNAIVIWVAIAVIIFLAAGTITSKGLGPISRWWYDFAKQRREAAAAREASDIASLRRQVTNLLGMREADSEALNQMRAFVVEVSEWGFEVRSAAGAVGLDLPEFPKLHN